MMFVQCNKNNKYHKERHVAAKPLNRSLTVEDKRLTFRQNMAKESSLTQGMLRSCQKDLPDAVSLIDS
jgi:hypothetical protein